MPISERQTRTAPLRAPPSPPTSWPCPLPPLPASALSRCVIAAFELAGARRLESRVETWPEQVWEDGGAATVCDTSWCLLNDGSRGQRHHSGRKHKTLESGREGPAAKADTCREETRRRGERDREGQRWKQSCSLVSQVILYLFITFRFSLFFRRRRQKRPARVPRHRKWDDERTAWHDIAQHSTQPHLCSRPSRELPLLINRLFRPVCRPSSTPTKVFIHSSHILRQFN